MPFLPSQHRKNALVTAGFLALAGAFSATFLLSRSLRADAETEARYPFDPACPWGRVANGQGMLKRCMTESEAKRVSEGLEKSKPSAAACSAPTGEPASVPLNPVRVGEAPRGEAAPAASPEVTAPTKGPRPFSLKLASIVAEEGEISLGKLSKPMDRYRQCVEQNGGLTSSKASVQLNFLVRAELGRAEGVELKKYSGVSQEVAKCLADVVDRRATGTPSSAMTGVTLTFEITEVK